MGVFFHGHRIAVTNQGRNTPPHLFFTLTIPTLNNKSTQFLHYYYYYYYQKYRLSKRIIPFESVLKQLHWKYCLKLSAEVQLHLDIDFQRCESSRVPCQ